MHFPCCCFFFIYPLPTKLQSSILYRLNMFSHFPSNRALAAKKLGIPAPASSAPQARDDGSYLLPVQKSHPVPTTIRHWQLRDVISSPLPNTVVHPHENALHFVND
ncbi:uncharacterized protein BYT42DRAFT_28050 [Radiomyces spectabilis]|uniref:uncharacterized protein n=1 Tax=Radiomyces spectabilis TaxID=64574 RepID=UPI00221F572C|nr:uncharacterized protein BYT42DRAFT_28050 [Radiomyces spectabilis]KAI8394022.1 hypothetical protein BYT42DRAFT_28050 [Radiomyces spectabilis]